MPALRQQPGDVRIRRVSRSCANCFRAQTLGQSRRAGILHGAAGFGLYQGAAYLGSQQIERLTVRVIYDTSMPKRCMLKSLLMRRAAF